MEPLETGLLMFVCRYFAVLLVVSVVIPLAAAEPKISYSRQIKPILSGKCFACHGPDEKERKAELRLDIRDEAVISAIVPGMAAESELINRITTTDADLAMPPADSKKQPVTAEEVALIRSWIDEGAEYDAHWAYLKPTRPAIPDVADKSWPANPID